jgi:peptidase E
MEQVKHMQEIYRLRLTHYMHGLHELQARRKDLPEDLIDPELEHAFEMVRALDSRHLAAIKAVHEAFRARWEPEKRDNVMDHYYELTETLERCGAVIIAGGHVAVLLNRLRLLKLEPFLREKPVIAWSAGAMALGSQVVLFHDSPPQGPGYAEVFEAGLGLYDDVIPLPHADKRLLLGDRNRVSLFARRFQHARCLTLENGSRIDRIDDSWRGETHIRLLCPDGSVEELDTP